MIVYSSTKDGFCQDVLTNQIEDKILAAFMARLGHRTSPSEILSWKESMVYMNNLFHDADIPADAGVAIEYRIPQTSKRVDFILTGKNGEKQNTAIIVELKRWSKAEATELDGIVSTFVGHAEREVSHPSYQAWTYAALIEDFNESVHEHQITLKPCAYLHNYSNDGVLAAPFYKEHLNKAPLFLKEDALKLQTFIKQWVKYGDTEDILYKIENGRIRPSKNLADKMVSMLRGNREFIMIDDQKLVYETARSLCLKSGPANKNVLIVEGGPGTGKSVVAVNLLADLIGERVNARYVTKNAAPRAVYESKLTGEYKKSHISNLFTGSGVFTETKANEFDALIVDEAHRLNEKSGMYQNMGENQIKEIIHSSACSIFFIDEDQRVTLKDAGESASIRSWARELKAKVTELKLESQFRCNGSDGYIAWLDNTLGIKETANETLEDIPYDFRIFDDPNELRRTIEEKNAVNNKARLVAGYCWPWNSKKNPNAFDIILPEFNFEARWNLTKDGGLWIVKPESVSEVGCIHTCQGLELEYVGVIIGEDFIVRNGEILANAGKRAGSDASVKGYKSGMKKDPEGMRQRMDAIIKNTYRTLMSRGMKGCYIYCVDRETAEYFKQAMGRVTGPAEAPNPEDSFLANEVVSSDKKYVEYLPVYSLEAAASKFSGQQIVEETGWCRITSGIRLNEEMFVAKVNGRSMEPRIDDGSYCIFRFHRGGTREGQVVLVESDLVTDAELGGCYTIKKYHSEKEYFDDGTWRHKKLVLEPVNPEFEPMIFEDVEPGSLKVVAEFVGVV